MPIRVELRCDGCLIPQTNMFRDGLGWNPLSSQSMIVEPGDAEVERGSNVIVTAKYGSQVPSIHGLYTTKYRW